MSPHETYGELPAEALASDTLINGPACPPFAEFRRRLAQGDRTALASLLGITSAEAAKLINALAHLEAKPRRSR